MEIIWSTREDRFIRLGSYSANPGDVPAADFDDGGTDPCRKIGQITRLETMDGELILHVQKPDGRMIRVYDLFLCPCLEAFLELMGPNKILDASAAALLVKSSCIDGRHEKCADYPDKCPRVMHFFNGLDDELE